MQSQDARRGRHIGSRYGCECAHARTRSVDTRPSAAPCGSGAITTEPEHRTSTLAPGDSRGDPRAHRKATTVGGAKATTVWMQLLTEEHHNSTVHGPKISSDARTVLLTALTRSTAPRSQACLENESEKHPPELAHHMWLQVHSNDITTRHRLQRPDWPGWSAGGAQA